MYSFTRTARIELLWKLHKVKAVNWMQPVECDSGILTQSIPNGPVSFFSKIEGHTACVF